MSKYRKHKREQANATGSVIVAVIWLFMIFLVLKACS